MSSALSWTKPSRFLNASPPVDSTLGKAFPFVIYHDGLTGEQDGTVEVCQPIRGTVNDSVLPGDVVIRSVEAHREAWVTVTKAELELSLIHI